MWRPGLSIAGSVADSTCKGQTEHMRAAELDRRIDDLARDPGAGEPWDVVRERIEQRLHKAG